MIVLNLLAQESIREKIRGSDMAKYRKKPVVIEAMQYHSNTQYDELKSFVGVDLFVDMKTSSVKDTGIKIHTLEGDHAICYSDFIIKGVQGEFYPCKPDIFEATYEEVTG